MFIHETSHSFRRVQCVVLLLLIIATYLPASLAVQSTFCLPLLFVQTMIRRRLSCNSPVESMPKINQRWIPIMMLRWQMQATSALRL
jgi:hypothetical protein